MIGNRNTRRRSKPLIVLSTMALAFAFILPLTGVASATHGSRTLEVTPETATNPADDVTEHVLTATLSLAAVAEVDVDFEIESGPTDTDGNTPLTPDFTCTVAIDASTCTVNIGPSADPGTDAVRAWIDHDTLNTTVEADTTEGLDEVTSDGAVAEPDVTDVVEKDWTQFVETACIDAEPNTAFNPAGSDHLVEAEVTDSDLAPTDADDTFDCAGSVLQGVDVEITITDDAPNIFISSVNGVDTGGPTGGGPNSETATTGADGMLEFTIALVNPDADLSVDFTNSVELVVVGAGGDGSVETVEKTWGVGGEPDAVLALPETDTNEIDQAHSVTGTVLDVFEDPVDNVNVDFLVADGVHSGEDLDSNADTIDGYFGDCNTGTEGTCSQSYTGSIVGVDLIVVFVDEDGDDVWDGGELFDIVFKNWVDEGEGAAAVRLDMDGCDGDLTDPIDEATWEDSADNAVGDIHLLCAEVFDSGDGQLEAPVTFTLTGPGFFTDETGTEDLGTTVTLEDSFGSPAVNEVYITSHESGATTVTASSHGFSDTGTKTWTAAPDTARNIDALPDTASNEPGTIHTVTATVTDRFGNPVPDVEVTFTETGTGAFRTGGSLVVAFTDDAGVATAETTTLTTELGVQTIVAEITEDPSECALDADDPEAGDPAGNCTDTVTKTWEEPPVPPECPGFEGDPRNDVIGTGAPDTLIGTGAADIICGKGGADEINGKGGKDLLLGGGGNDDIFGKKGNDTLKGGKGKDLLNGGKGTDVCKGGPGKDTTKNCE